MALAIPAVPGVRSRFVDVDGLSVHVAEAGEGPPLVLLHGWPQHWWCWRRVVPLLASDHRLLMPDLRGHGWTDAPPTGYDKEQFATDLLGLLDALGLDRVGLIGHDWGGWTGFLAALRAPERFRGLLALSIIHPFQRPDLRLLSAGLGAYQLPLATPLAELALRANPRLVPALIRAGSVRPIPAKELTTYGEVLAEPARARASVLVYRTFLLQEAGPVFRGRYDGQRLAVPTRLVGGADVRAARLLLRGLEEHADDARVELLPGVGHFLPEEAPEAVAAAARELFGPS